MNRSKIITLLLLFPAIFFGQEKLLRFKVEADSIAVAQMNVVNLVNEKSAMSDGNGEFTLLAKEGDLLFLQAAGFEVKRKLIETQDMTAVIVLIVMTRKANELDEVVVTRYDKHDDLIMRHRDHRDFTPAERKLYTAQTGPLDIVANIISGRTSMLKKELQVEMNERLLARMEIQFEDEYYTDTLKIPQEHIGGFQRYLIENQEFVAALKAKNKTLMQFLISKQAVNYLELIKTQ